MISLVKSIFSKDCWYSIRVAIVEYQFKDELDQIEDLIHETLEWESAHKEIERLQQLPWKYLKYLGPKLAFYEGQLCSLELLAREESL